MPPLSWTHGRLESIDTCPCCGTSAHGVREYARKDDELSFNDIWTFNQCTHCSSIFLRRRPDAESLPLAYEHYYTHASVPAEATLSNDGTSLRDRMVQGYLAKRFGFPFPAPSALGAALVRLLPPVRMLLDMYGRHVPRGMCNPKTRLLDIGCGNGSFLLRAREMGLSAMGCEPDPKAVETCLAQGLDVILGDAFDERLRPDSFDIITMHHVIEHVTDPVALLDRARSLLKPGGQLWLGLPNPEAISLKLFGSSWVGFHPPFHLIIPTQAVLQRWLDESGFQSPTVLRRGMQSRGLWNLSARLYQREHGRRATWSTPMRLAIDLLASLVPRFGEESVITATRPHDDA